MPLSIRSWFRTMDDYAYETVSVPEDEVCMCCRDTFSQDGSLLKCSAIRLTACSHIIGDKCFRDWIQHNSDACPYWNHALPTITREEWCCSNALYRFLGLCCSNFWFDSKEEFMYNVVVIPYSLETIVRDTTGALLSDRLTLVDAVVLFVAFGVGSEIQSLIITFVLLLLSFVALTLIALAGFFFELSFSVLPLFSSCFRGAWYIQTTEVIFYQLVLLYVLGVGWWRSWVRVRAA